MINVREGMAEVLLDSDENVRCADHKCGRFIAPKEKCFLDMLADNEDRVFYCLPCGQCERYRRVKARHRGEQA